MSMTGVFVDTAAVFLGGLIGLVFRKKISEKLTSAVMIGLGLYTVCIGVNGTLNSENTLIDLASIAVGAVIGTKLDIDGKLNMLGKWAERRLPKREKSQTTVAEGFVAASILFCVGAMPINGALNAGISGDNSFLYTKSMLDFVSAIVMTASMGLGVPLTAIMVLVLEGSLVILANGFVSVFTPDVVTEMSCIGSIIIIAIGTNLMGVSKIKTADYSPAILLAPIFCKLASILSAIRF